MWKRQGQVPRYMQTTAQSLTPFPLVSLTKIHYLATLLALFRLLSVPGSTRKIVRKREKVQLPHGMDPCTCLRDNAQWDPQWGQRGSFGSYPCPHKNPKPSTKVVFLPVHNTELRSSFSCPYAISEAKNKKTLRICQNFHMKCKKCMYWQMEHVINYKASTCNFHKKYAEPFDSIM
jgi:hypothetical protein